MALECELQQGRAGPGRASPGVRVKPGTRPASATGNTFAVSLSRWRAAAARRLGDQPRQDTACRADGGQGAAGGRSPGASFRAHGVSWGPGSPCMHSNTQGSGGRERGSTREQRGESGDRVTSTGSLVKYQAAIPPCLGRRTPLLTAVLAGTGLARQAHGSLGPPVLPED